MFSPQQKEMQDKAVAGNKQYKNRNKSFEDDFFSIIEEHGDATLRQLCEVITFDDGITVGRRFYNDLGGEKTPAKKLVLDKMLKIFLFNRINKKDPSKPLDSTSSAQMFKQLFVVFHGKGIRYDYQKDFKGPGELSACWEAKYKQHRKEDP